MEKIQFQPESFFKSIKKLADKLKKENKIRQFKFSIDRTEIPKWINSDENRINYIIQLLLKASVERVKTKKAALVEFKC